jgi:glyoxylase-like metal-dependent hydrolase (beta-lactamase superfamily II)
VADASLRIVPLGGQDEVGKNMIAFESGGEILVVDAGLAFPRDEHLGVDLVLPDFAWLRERARDIRAVVLTHGHEDHVGALPYFLRQVGAPEVRATKLTLELVASKLDEHGLLRATELREAVPEDGPIALGPTRRQSSWRRRRAASCIRATTRSTTRPSTAFAPMLAGLPRSGTEGSTSCSVTRRMPSGLA